MATSFREALVNDATPPLAEGEGRAILEVVGTMLDADVDLNRHGMAARLPSYGTDDSLAAIGRDRQIVRGFAEDAETYGLRLTRWLEAHERAGSPWEIMRQLQAYLTPHEVRVRIVNHRGNWYTRDADGTQTATLGASNWNWDSETYPPGPDPWSRFWVILYPPTELWAPLPPLDDPSLWGGALDLPGYTIGSTATPEQVASVRKIVGDWRDEKSQCVGIIVSFDAALFDPEDAQPPNPDGWHGNASRVIAGVRTPTRSSDAIYWPGSVGSPYEGLV